MIERESSWQSDDGIPFFTLTWEPETAPRAAIVLVHGLGEHCSRYRHLAEFLTQAGYAILTFDHRGHGKSGGPRGHAPSYDRMAADIDHFVQEARQHYPGLPVFVYGHSLGGALTLYYLFTCKPALQGTVVTSPGLATGQPVSGGKLLLARTLSRLLPTVTMPNGLDRENLSHDRAVIEAYNHDPLNHGVISTRLGNELISKGAWMQTQTSLHLPLLLMQGSADHLVSPAATRVLAKNLQEQVTYVEWPGLYHELHNEPQKQEIFDTVLTWLNAHLPKA